VSIPKEVSGLPKDSVANVSQVVTVDKSFLTQRAGFLRARFMEQIEAGLRLVLDL
jgi:mRNA interferase MazF